MAENKLITEDFSRYLSNPSIAGAAFATDLPTPYCYNDFLGLPQAKSAVAYFFARKFLLLNGSDRTSLTVEEATQNILPQHIAIGSGCSSLLNYLFYILAEEGDAVLIPAPYYAAFEHEMSVRSLLFFTATFLHTECICMIIQLDCWCPFILLIGR